MAVRRAEAIRCRIFTPALPVCSTASVRDFCPGAYMDPRPRIFTPSRISRPSLSYSKLCFMISKLPETTSANAGLRSVELTVGLVQFTMKQNVTGVVPTTICPA